MEVSTSLDVPVLLIMFNRPAQALQVFNRIREAKPKALYLTVDGPRSDRPAEEQLVLQCRDLKNYVDWPCTVYTLFREKNFGCKKAVSSAINWFFEHVDAGIILEDDCLPNLTFFNYCQTLLLKYENDQTVMHIGGCNLYKGVTWGNDAYFFTKITHIWGWATWRRAWILYDVEMRAFPEFDQAGGLNDAVSYAPSRSYFRHSFSETYAGRCDTWDYQWVFAIWANRGLSVIPNRNLISNIGFGKAATHTIEDSEFSNLPTISITAEELTKPVELALNLEATNYAFAHFYRSPPWWRTKLNTLKRLLIKRKT